MTTALDGHLSSLGWSLPNPRMVNHQKKNCSLGIWHLDLTLFPMAKYKSTSLATKGALAHCLQLHTARKIQNGRQGAPKWLMGSGKVLR